MEKDLQYRFALTLQSENCLMFYQKLGKLCIGVFKIPGNGTSKPLKRFIRIGSCDTAKRPVGPLEESLSDTKLQTRQRYYYLTQHFYQ